MSKAKKNKEFENIPGKNPFSVPDGYFDNLTDRLEKKIKSKPEKESGKISFWRGARNQLALAAGFLVFVMISWAVMHFVINGDSADQQTGMLYADMIESEIENYDTYMLLEAFEEIEEPVDLTVSEQYKDEMIDYLVNEDIDIEMIINEF